MAVEVRVYDRKLWTVPAGTCTLEVEEDCCQVGPWVSYESVQTTCKNLGGQTVHKYGARLRTMEAILFPVVDVEYSCPPGPLFGQKIDHMHERDNTHAIVSGSGRC